MGFCGGLNGDRSSPLKSSRLGWILGYFQDVLFPARELFHSECCELPLLHRSWGVTGICGLFRISYSGLFGRAAEKVCGLWEEGVMGMVEESKMLAPSLVGWWDLGSLHCGGALVALPWMGKWEDDMHCEGQGILWLTCVYYVSVGNAWNIDLTGAWETSVVTRALHPRAPIERGGFWDPPWGKCVAMYLWYVTQ